MVGLPTHKTTASPRSLCKGQRYPDRRRRPRHGPAGLGNALTRAAIQPADDVRELWISADDEDRPKHRYGRLGFSSSMDGDGVPAAVVSASRWLPIAHHDPG
jgi:hypothetical protein